MPFGNIYLISSKAQFKKYLKEAERLIALNPGKTSANGKRLTLLVALLEIYEVERFPIDHPTPLGAIEFRMDQQNLKPKDLIKYIGPQPRVSKILNGKRALSLEMIRKLHEGLGIPAVVLIRKMKIKRAK